MNELLTLTHPFTHADAETLGVSRQQLRTLVAAGTVRSLTRGWFCVRQEVCDDDELRLNMALREAPAGAVLTGAFAARLAGIWVPDLNSHTQVEFIMPANGAPRTRETTLLHVANRPIPRAHIVSHKGIRMTSVQWTALELALAKPLPLALIPLDSALRLGATRAQLQRLSLEFRGRRGCGVLPQGVAEASALAESALESRSRGHFIVAGLPAPELQRQVRLADGRSARADFAWLRWNLVGEADGLIKYDEVAHYRKEKIREMRIRRTGLQVERWTNWDLDHGLDGLLDRLTQHMMG